MKRTLLVLFVFISIVFKAQTRYWVGGSGSWDNPAKWAITSGGAGGATVPLSTDDVIFNALSGTGVVTIPSAATSLAKSITFTATAMNTITGTGRMDVTSHLTLQSGMNLIGWTGSLYFYTPATVVLTRTITTNNNTFKNNLIQFELPSSGSGGNVFVLGNFNHGGSSCIINLQNKANTVTFNNGFTFGGTFDIQVGTANMMTGFAWYRTYVQAFTGALNSWGNGTGDEFHTSGDTDFNAGNTLTGNNYAFRTMENVYTANTYNGSLSMVNCTVSISYRWEWASQAGGAAQILNAAGSTIRFTGAATHFLPRDFNYHTVICDNDPGNSFITFRFGTFYSAPAHTTQPNFNNLILDRNMSFAFSQASTTSRCYPTINTLMKLTPGHRYIYSSTYSEAIGSAFRFNIPNASTLDMQGLCTFPIWLQKMAWEFGSTATILSDNIKANGIYACDNISPYSICSPTKNIGANSFNITTSPTASYAGWNLDITRPIHRNLVWVGPIPAVTTNTAQYGNWYDQNNWVDVTANPTWTASALIAPGNPSLSPTCPPTHRDSVIFPNSSYTNCDKVISYCEGMNWQGTGRLFAAPGKEMEIWGSLFFSNSMLNDFNGTFWFKSDRTYRCWITTNNQAFDLGAVFSSDNGNGSWELRDTLKVPFQDPDATGFYNGGASFKLIAGNLHTGNTNCLKGNGQTIEVFGMHLNGGALNLYNSDVYIKGDVAAGSYVFYVSNYAIPYPSTRINAGTSNLIFIDSYSPGSLTTAGTTGNNTQKAYLGWGKKYYDITLKMPASGTYVDYTHFIAMASDTVRRIVAETNVMPQINTMHDSQNGYADKKGGYIRMLDLKTSKLSAIKVHSQSYTHDGTFDNARSIIIDSLQAMGNIDFGQNVNIRSYLKFQAGSTYALGSTPTGVTAITITLSATTPVSGFSYESCPVTPVSYGPATFVANGTCTDLITILNGTFVANSTNTVNVSYANITDNVVTGPSAPFNYNNSNLTSSTGWTGTSGLPRKLRWKDVSGINANIGNWNNSNYWELVIGGTSTQTVIASAPQCPPSRIDTAVFDNTSFTANNQRVNVTNGITDIGSIYWQNITAGTNPQFYTAINTNRLDVFASLAFHINMQQSFAGPILFRGSSTYGAPTFSISTITCAKKAFNSKIDFLADGPKIWSLQDSLTALNNSTGISYLQQTGTFNLVKGEFRTNGNPMYIGTFNSNSALARKINMTNSTITINYGFSTLWAYGNNSWLVCNNPTTFSVISTGSTLNLTHSQYQGIIGGGKKYNNVNFKNFTISAGVYGGGGTSSYTAPDTPRDTFNIVTFIGTGTSNIGMDPTGYGNAGVNNNSRFTKVITNCPFIVESSSCEFDTLIMNHNGTIRKNQKYNKYTKFSPARNYTIGSGTIQWFKNLCQVDLFGYSGSNIQLYSSITSQQAYFRKDSAYMCTDFINMRDIWAIGNGNNPISCVSFTNTGINTICPPIASYTTHAVSLCDTIVDNASACGPWDLTNLTRGRSDFNAGTNADLQGNDAGWVKRAYPPTPILNLTNSSYSICPSDSIILNMTGIANPPFTLFYLANGVANNYSISSTAQLAAYNPTTSAFTFTVLVKPTVNTIYTLGALIIDRCFNSQSAAGTGTVNVVLRPIPSGITSSFSPSALVCNGGALTLTSSASNGSVYTLYPSATGTTGAIPMTSFTTGAVTNGSITINATGSFTAGLTPTTYTLYTEVISQFGCYSSIREPVIFTINPIPQITSSSSQTLCTGNTATISPVNNFTTGVTNNWTSSTVAGITGHSTSGSSNISETLINTTTSPLTVLYTYTPATSSCAGATQQFSVTVNPAPTLTSITNTTICSGNTTALVLSSNISASTYTWLATDNTNTTGESLTTQSTNTLSNTLLNSSLVSQNVIYTVTPTAVLGSCKGAPQTITVTVNPTPVMTSANTATICTGNTVTIPLTANVASTFSWVATDNTNTTGESLTVQTSSTLNNTLLNGSGTAQQVIYNVVPMSTLGSCIGNVQTLSVTVNPLPVVTAAPSSTAICIGQTATLTAGGANTYTWTSGPTTATYTVNTAGVYTVSGTNTLTGCINTRTVSLIVNALPVVTAVPSSPAICVGATATLTAAGASTYTWTSGPTTSTYTTSTAGTYTVTGTDLNNCVNTRTVSVIVNANPILTTTGTLNVACLGTPTGSISTTASGTSGYSFAWNPAVSTTNTATGLSAGVYTTTVTDVNGCRATVANTIAAPSTSLTASIATSTTGCGLANGTATVTASGGWSTSYTYVWQSSTSTTTLATGYSANSYTSSVTDANGCVLITPFTIVNPNSPTLTATVSNSVMCSGNSSIITPSLTSSVLSYSVNGIATAGPSFTVTPLTTTVYNINATDVSNCVSNLLSLTITVNATPTLALALSSTSICIGTSAILTPSGADTYTLINTSESILTNTVVNPTSTTVYTVSGTSLAGCLGATETITLTVNALPSLTLSASNNTICSGNSSTLIVTGADTYSWTTGVTTDTYVVSPTSTTVYEVVGTNTLTNCNSASNQFTVTVNTTPTVTANASAVTVCSNGTISLNASGATTYTWSGTGITSLNENNASPSFTVPTAGTYTYTLLGSSTEGCTSSSSTVVVSVVASPSSSLSIASASICQGGTASFEISNPQGGVVYTWNAVSTGTNYTVSSPTTDLAGTYTVNVIAMLGSGTNTCSTNTTGTLTVNATPTIAIDQTNITICDGEQAVFSIINPLPSPASYVWSYDNSTGNSLTVSNLETSATGNYSVTITDANGCVNQTTFDLTVNGCGVFIPEIFSPNGDGKNDVFEIKGIQYYPNNKLIIYNRWGSKVYEKEKYNNEWEGKANVNTGTGKELLPSGTYYVIFEYTKNDKNETYKGYVQLEY